MKARVRGKTQAQVTQAIKRVHPLLNQTFFALGNHKALRDFTFEDVQARIHDLRLHVVSTLRSGLFFKRLGDEMLLQNVGTVGQLEYEVIEETRISFYVDQEGDSAALIEAGNDEILHAL